MKQYLLFIIQTLSEGGVWDFHKSYDSFEEAQKEGKKFTDTFDIPHPHFFDFHILDTKTGEVYSEVYGFRALINP
jgi:hypothetical protein